MSGAAAERAGAAGSIPRPRAYRGCRCSPTAFGRSSCWASFYAGLAILVWLPVFYGELTLASAFAPRDWHVHEMLYGYSRRSAK